MAADWIPCEIGLFKKAEVLAIASKTKRSRHDVGGLLLEFWGWCSNESTDGHMPNVGIDMLPGIVGGDRRFWEAVVAAGWLIIDGDGFAVPNAERWISRGAKARLGAARRKQKQRGWTGQMSQAERDDGVTGGVTTEQQQQQNSTEDNLESPGVLQQPPQPETGSGSSVADLVPIAEQLARHPFMKVLDHVQGLHALRGKYPAVDLATEIPVFLAQLDEATVAAHRRAGRGPARALQNWVSKAAQIAAQEPNHGRSHRPEGRTGSPGRQAPGAGHRDLDPYAEDRARMERQRRDFEARKAVGGGNGGA